MSFDRNSPALAGPQPVSVLLQTALSLTATQILASANSANASGAAAALAAFEYAIALNYLAANPGAAWFANLPTSLPGASGAWWLDGNVVSKS